MNPSAGKSPSRQVALAHWDAYELNHRLSEGEPSPLSQSVIPNLRAGGVSGLVLIVGGDSKDHCAYVDDPLLGALVFQDGVIAELAANDNDVRVVRTATDLGKARAADQIWCVLGLEGCRPLRGRLEALHAFFRLGMRVLGLTWNGRNEVGDGVGVDSPRGLTPFGHDVLREAHALGMLVDVSHLAPVGLADVLSATDQPVIASHTNARVVAEHPRNLGDAELRAIADTGGLIGVNFLPSFLNPASPATIDDLVRQIDYLITLVGLDHVAMGGDLTYDPWRATVAKTRSYEGVQVNAGPGHRGPVHEFPEIGILVSALSALKLSEPDLDALLYGNLHRLIESRLPQVPRTAA